MSTFSDLSWRCSCNASFTGQLSRGGVSMRFGQPAQPAQLTAISEKLGLQLEWDEDARRGVFLDWKRPQGVDFYHGPLPYTRHGFDPVCGAEDVFTAKLGWFREEYKSHACHTLPRERALAWVLNTALPQWRDATVHESSPNPHGLSGQLRQALDARYTGSQYHPTLPCGARVPGGPGGSGGSGDVVCDLEHQCFPNQSFDLVVTQDVFEHVYDPPRALAEISRTLRPGGVHLFTVPVTSKRHPTFRTARRVVRDGKVAVELHAPPEVHGNPAHGGGSLLTHQWGYDLLRKVQEWTGMATRAVFVESPRMGVEYAEYREVYLSRKHGNHPLFPVHTQKLGVGHCPHRFVSCDVE